MCCQNSEDIKRKEEVNESIKPIEADEQCHPVCQTKKYIRTRNYC